MRFLLLLATSAVLRAQAPGGQPEIVKSLQAIAANAQRLGPMLAQMKPQTWVAKGAPDTYVSQWQSAQAQCEALSTDAWALTQHPDKLTDVLKVLFRVQFIEIALGSLEEGVKKYQNPALAELLSGTRAEDTPHREKLQQFALDLADQTEQDFRVADKEAQRCRGQLSRETPKNRQVR